MPRSLSLNWWKRPVWRELRTQPFEQAFHKGDQELSVEVLRAAMGRGTYFVRPGWKKTHEAVAAEIGVNPGQLSRGSMGHQIMRDLAAALGLPKGVFFPEDNDNQLVAAAARQLVWTSKNCSDLRDIGDAVPEIAQKVHLTDECVSILLQLRKRLPSEEMNAPEAFAYAHYRAKNSHESNVQRETLDQVFMAVRNLPPAACVFSQSQINELTKCGCEPNTRSAQVLFTSVNAVGQAVKVAVEILEHFVEAFYQETNLK